MQTLIRAELSTIFKSGQVNRNTYVVNTTMHKLSRQVPTRKYYLPNDGRCLFKHNDFIQFEDLLHKQIHASTFPEFPN